MNQTVRSVRILVVLLTLIASVPMSLAAPEGGRKPNIVLVLMDNFGYGEPGVYGGGALRGAPTPRIDSIAAEGFQLTNFNVEAECTPSRASLMTGRYGIRTRQLPGDVPPRDIWEGISSWEITLAEMLTDA
ncbi:MAG: arylsulfatase A-like enzyme, partial [Cryomorphaceae bacterium]